MRQSSLTIPLRVGGLGRQGRRLEPVTFGVPVPRGSARPGMPWALRQGDTVRPVQVDALDLWGDGSIRWLLVHGQIDGDDAPLDLGVASAPSCREPGATCAVALDGSVRITTGVLEVSLQAGPGFPVRAVQDHAGRACLQDASLEIRSPGGERWSCAWSGLTVERAGPMRVEVRADGEARAGGRRLAVQAHVVAHAGLPTLSVRLVLTNPAGARHPGGRWDLGDPASLLLSEVALCWRAPASFVGARVDAGDASAPAEADLPCVVYQASSGGDHWDSPVHLTRSRRVALDFRGYALEAPGLSRRGDRATPVVSMRAGGHAWHVTAHPFWQVAPKAIEVEGRELRCGLFPRQAGEPQELQPGERTSWTSTVAFADDPVSASPLDWVRRPAIVGAEPAWVASTGAIRGLTAVGTGQPPEYDRLVWAAVDGPECFEAKRERIDEYGWRHFGDLHADHEAVQAVDPARFVSHWNNHYDAALGGWIQYLRSGDRRWWQLAQDLVAHAADGDIYRTHEDKSAYAGGMFWHTAHHVDADLSTHRTYPSRGRAGGGPSSGQLYNGGFLLAWFLTGDVRYREAVRELADYVVTSEDGARTMFRWLDRSPTGHMSHSGPGYHGPGRAAANAIQAALNGHRLTGDPRHLAIAEQLLRRAVHPRDDVAARQLLDAERRWFYTMFLQVVAAWLDDMDEQGRHDATYAYARDSLVAYARWMALHERPYLNHPEALEYPTETWVAQEFRKADVLVRAARHVGGDARQHWLARADEFFAYALRELPTFPSRTFCRPVVLCMTNGWAHAWHVREVPGAPPPVPLPTVDHGEPMPFVAQRDRARRAAVRVACAGIVLTLLAFAWMLARWR